MAEVRVRNLDDGVVQEFKERAKRTGTSVEAILRALITSEAQRPRKELIADLLRHQQKMRDACGVLPDSTPLIREERDRIG